MVISTMQTIEGSVHGRGNLQQTPSMVYDILPPTTATFDYAVGLERLSANEQFFDDAQMAVSL